MTLKQRWLFAIVSCVAVGVFVQAALAIALSARTQREADLAHARTALEGYLRAEHDGLRLRALHLSRKLDAAGAGQLISVLTASREFWLVVEGGQTFSSEADCRLVTDVERNVVWCGERPMLAAPVQPGTVLLEPLSDAHAQAFAAATGFGMVFRGPYGVVGSSRRDGGAGEGSAVELGSDLRAVPYVARRAPWGQLATMLGVGALLIGAVVFVGRRLVAVFSRPLKKLEAAARRAAEGEAFDVDVDSGSFELLSLTSSFVAMNHRAQESQQRAAQSEKMAALGTLAGGIAHEINNPLGVILGFAQGLERRVRDGDPLRMPVTSIVREALRCKTIVQEMLTFSRVSKKRDEPVDVAAAIDSSLVLLGARAKTQGVTIVPRVDDTIPRVRGSRTQLQQVLVNLGTNALDAMKGGGTLEVSAATRDGAVVLEVADTGTGIPLDIRSRIFEPFFTTKGVGEGTGLGLSIVYQIVQQHRGRVDVVSSSGRGTVMRVALPAQREEARVATVGV